MTILDQSTYQEDLILLIRDETNTYYVFNSSKNIK